MNKIWIISRLLVMPCRISFFDSFYYVFSFRSASFRCKEKKQNGINVCRIIVICCFVFSIRIQVCVYLQSHLLQEHGLGARPYDCRKCTLKFFFNAELDHHILTFHRPRDEIHPSSVENAREMKNREPDGGVTVKEEVIQGGKEEEEEEEVNVDDQIGQEEHDETKREEQKLKTEVDIETTSNKMES